MAQAGMVGDAARRGNAALSTYLRYARRDHLHPTRPRLRGRMSAARPRRKPGGELRKGVTVEVAVTVSP